MGFDVTYWLIALVGLIIILIEAHRQFAQRDLAVAGSAYDILNGVELEAMAPRNVFLRGYVFYMLCYVAVYAAGLSLVKIGDLLISAENFASNVGPQGDLPFVAPDSFLRQQDGGTFRPLLIAIGITSMLSIGIANRVENALRGFAHSLAGIPNSIYRVIARMNQFDYAPYAPSSPTSRSVRAAGVVQQFQSRVVGQEEIDELSRDLAIIDVLAPVTVGVLNEQVFPTGNVVALNKLIAGQSEAVDAFDKRLGAISSPDEVLALAAEARRLRQNLQALFAILFTRNRNKVQEGFDIASNRLAAFLNRNTSAYLTNGVVGAVFLAFLITLGFAFINEASYSKLLSKPPADFYAAIRNDWALIVRDAFNAAISAAILFLVAARLSIGIRRAAKSARRWPTWRLNDIPFWRLLRVAAMPALCAAAALFVALMFHDAAAGLIVTGFFPSQDILMQSAQIYSHDFARSIVCGLIVGCGVLFVADLHVGYRWFTTLLFALLWVLPFAMLAFLMTPPNESAGEGVQAQFVFRESIYLSVFALSFFGFFSLYLESRPEDASDE